jgi:hypothetical protein
LGLTYTSVSVNRLSVLLLLIVFSCSKIEKKTEHVVHKTADKATNFIKQQTFGITDRLFPIFDSNQPDTKNNKIRFRDFIKIELTPDVKNIYCFDDAVGIDASYMFAFNCNPGTSDKIIARHHLTLDTLNPDNGFAIQHDFEWWNKKKIEKLQKYSWTNGKSYYKYYWYDAEAQKAYFFDFDL